jgi:hypothetical protein
MPAEYRIVIDYGAADLYEKDFPNRKAALAGYERALELVRDHSSAGRFRQSLGAIRLEKRQVPSWEVMDQWTANEPSLFDKSIWGEPTGSTGLVVTVTDDEYSDDDVLFDLDPDNDMRVILKDGTLGPFLDGEIKIIRDAPEDLDGV